MEPERSGWLRVDELEAAFALIIASVRRRFGAQLDLTTLKLEGYYWTIPPDDAFSLVDPPPSPTVGDLADDVLEIRSLLARDDGEVFIWHDVEHFAGLLRGLAYRDRAQEPDQ